MQHKIFQIALLISALFTVTACVKYSHKALIHKQYKLINQTITDHLGNDYYIKEFELLGVDYKDGGRVFHVDFNIILSKPLPEPYAHNYAYGHSCDPISMMMPQLYLRESMTFTKNGKKWECTDNCLADPLYWQGGLSKWGYNKEY